MTTTDSTSGRAGGVATSPLGDSIIMSDLVPCSVVVLTCGRPLLGNVIGTLPLPTPDGVKRDSLIVGSGARLADSDSVVVETGVAVAAAVDR